MKKTVVLLTIAVLVSAGAAFGAGNTMPRRRFIPRVHIRHNHRIRHLQGMRPRRWFILLRQLGIMLLPQWCIMHRLRFIMSLRQ